MLMRKEDKAKWVAALRSGKYSQCEGELSKNGGYCCLGVMEKVLGTGEVEEQGLPTPQWCSDNGVRFDNESSWDDDPHYHDEVSDEDMTKLAAMNDGKKKFTGLMVDGKPEYNWQEQPKPFPEIADWIEENVGTTD